MKEKVDVKKGQYWRDNDLRYRGRRIVQIVDVRGDMVRIKTVILNTGNYRTAGYVTWTKKERFENCEFTFLFEVPKQ